MGILGSVPAKVKKQKSPFEMRMAYFGLPVALVVLTPIWTMRTSAGLSYSGKMAMDISVFVLIPWVSNGIPNYVTSSIVTFLLLAAGVQAEKATLGASGYEVIWLMIAAFAIASGMEKSGLAERPALSLVMRFGENVNTVLIVLMVTNPLIVFVVPSTTARAVILLPIVMMIMEVFEMRNTMPQDRNSGKFMASQGIQANNLSTGAIVAAASSQILAISSIKDLIDTEISWMKWFIASALVAIITLATSFFIGKMLFKTGNRSASAEKMTALEEEHKGLGETNKVEVWALIIFLITILLWVIDEYHGVMLGFDISLVVVAIVSAAIFPMPHVGILTWKEVKIPWDLMTFSCGAYAGGLALDGTGVATWVLNNVFDKLGVEYMSFTALYAVIIFVASLSRFVLTSKTARIIILILTIISIAQVAGFNPVAPALSASFMICDTITLPPYNKVSLTYYSTGKFMVLEEMTYGVLILLAKRGIMVAASFIWFKMIGIMWEVNMKGERCITFMVAVALNMGLAVAAMVEGPGSGEPNGAQLGTMIEMADRSAPEGGDAAVISHIKDVIDGQGRLAVPMYQDAEPVSVQEGAGTPKGEPKEQHSGMISYLVANLDEAGFPVELTLNWHQEGTYKMKAAKTNDTAPGNLKAVTYPMANTVPVSISPYSLELAVPEGYEPAGIVGYDPEEEYGIFTDQGVKYGAYVFGKVPVGRECEMTMNIKKAGDNLALSMWGAATPVSVYFLYKNKGMLKEAKELAAKKKMGGNS